MLDSIGEVGLSYKSEIKNGSFGKNFATCNFFFRQKCIFASIRLSVSISHSLSSSHCAHAHTRTLPTQTPSLSFIKVLVHLMTKNAKMLYSTLVAEEKFLKHKSCNCLC